MFERYDKDVTDRKTKQVIHRKGDLKYGTYQDKDGKNPKQAPQAKELATNDYVD